MTALKFRNPKLTITIFVLLCSSFLLFFRLGHYALWDDEAITALFAESVWRTGDTHAKLDHNLIAYGGGAELKNLRNRYISPLGFYVAAPFVGLFDGSTFAARFPFALCGFLTVVLILFWLFKSEASLSMWLLMSAGMLGNVSFMLFSRQCRYYSLTIFFTTLLAYLYCNYKGQKRTVFLIPVVSILLLASNYMSYAAAYGCLIVDYFIWGRKKHPFKLSDIIAIFVPQLILGGILVSIYNPLGMNVWGVFDEPWLKHRLSLLLWNLRELNNCEFGVGIFLLAAPFIYVYKKDRFLLRCSVAIFIYCLIIAIVSPQPYGLFNFAIVRYLAPLIPLCILTVVICIQVLAHGRKWLLILIALLAFGTNVLHGGPLLRDIGRVGFSRRLPDIGFRSTIIEFIGELISPNVSAYRISSDWINQNLKEKESIAVFPGFANYPLLYHAPKAIYAWQLDEQKGQFVGLPDIHFREKVFPNYLIVFGPFIEQIEESIQKWKSLGVQYDLVDRLDVYWYDLTRPELYWHAFDEIKDFPKSSEAVYLFRKFP